MKQYNDYIYNGVIDNNKLNENQDYYRYNDSYFNEMLAKRQYQEAANYLRNFRFVGENSGIKNEKIRNKIQELEHKGKIFGEMYSNATPDQYEAIDFYQNIYGDGGSEYLLGVEYSDENGKRHLGNKYSFNYGMYKKALGSSANEEATAIRIEFQPEERTGWFGWDKLRKDGYNSYKSFIKNNGYFTEDDLQDIVTVGKDGKAIITIDKGDKRFNRLMDAIYNNVSYNPSTFLGGAASMFNPNPGNKTNYEYVVEKDISNKSNTNRKITIQGLNKDGGIIENGDIQSFYEMEDLITKAYNAQGEIIKNLKAQTKDYTTTIAGPVFDGLEELKSRLDRGEIDSKTFNREYNLYYKNIDAVINALGSSNTIMYSNFINENPNDELLQEADNTTRGDIIQEISKAAKSDLSYTTMLANGEIGTLITIKAKEGTKQNPEGRKRIQVFIPGLFHEQNQEKINKDTKILATQEVNDIINYGYNYNLVDDSLIHRDKIGNFYYNDTLISKEEAIDLINKSLIIERSSQKLLDEHINRNGEFVNEELYEQKAKELAIAASNELMPNTYFTRDNGKEINPNMMTLEDVDYIFNKKAIGSEPIKEEGDKMSNNEYSKYKDVYFIFDHIMSAMNVYKYKYNR